jgi:hypothetical protein
MLQKRKLARCHFAGCHVVYSAVSNSLTCAAAWTNHTLTCLVRSMPIYARSANTVTYATANYTSSRTTAVVYELRFQVEAMN